MVGFLGEPVVVHDFSAHEGFKWKGRKHVEAETQPRNVDHEIIVGKVVEHVAEGLVTERKVA